MKDLLNKLKTKETELKMINSEIYNLNAEFSRYLTNLEGWKTWVLNHLSQHYFSLYPRETLYECLGNRVRNIYVSGDLSSMMFEIICNIDTDFPPNYIKTVWFEVDELINYVEPKNLVDVKKKISNTEMELEYLEDERKELDKKIEDLKLKITNLKSWDLEQ